MWMPAEGFFHHEKKGNWFVSSLRNLEGSSLLYMSLYYVAAQLAHRKWFIVYMGYACITKQG